MKRRRQVVGTIIVGTLCLWACGGIYFPSEEAKLIIRNRTGSPPLLIDEIYIRTCSDLFDQEWGKDRLHKRMEPYESKEFKLLSDCYDVKVASVEIRFDGLAVPAGSSIVRGVDLTDVSTVLLS